MGLLRLLLLLMLGYLIWRIFQIVMRMGAGTNGPNSWRKSNEDPGKNKTISQNSADIRDAEFTEIPSSEPEKK
jgi:hypothetical protein